MRTAAKLWLHADYKVEQLFALDHLGDRLPAHCGGNYSFYIGNTDSVARDLVAVDIDEQTGLAKFAHNCELRETGDFGQNVFDLDRLVLKHIQVIAKDL